MNQYICVYYSHFSKTEASKANSNDISLKLSKYYMVNFMQDEHHTEVYRTIPLCLKMVSEIRALSVL